MGGGGQVGGVRGGGGVSQVDVNKELKFLRKSKKMKIQKKKMGGGGPGVGLGGGGVRVDVNEGLKCL